MSVKTNGTMDNGRSDEQLCMLAAAGDRDAGEELAVRYTRLVRACTRPYFLAGGDGEDLIQEGMFGLLKAMREYSPDKNTSFKTYAILCIKHRIYTVIRGAAGNKHAPLNNYVSFETPFFDPETDTFAYYAQYHDQLDPEELIIGQEKLRELSDMLSGRLSAFEARVLELYLKGLSYAEIASKLGKTPKSVDNAVQRIRRKAAGLK